jgi:asparagine synthase (glutamine-hydrolysing)
MCGIVGLIKKDKSNISLDVLSKMASVLEHRGPDDEGHYIEGTVGLYHKRLSIIDLASGHQPMVSRENIIVFNGEIYNYIELREELKKKGHTFKTKSDTEVILKMYEEYGNDFIKQLNGMFAFIIYDRRSKKLIAGRDHFGIKPLYYYNDSKQWIFASEIKAILQHPDVRAEVNYENLQEYLTFQFLLDDSTLFNKVNKIVPGTYLVIDLNTMESKRIKYWDPSFKIDYNHTEEYFVQELRNILEDSVNLRLRSDVPVGAYLSGGLDSSIVSMLASQKSSERLKTFTGAFNEGPEFNETEYSNEIAQAAGAEPYIVYPTVDEFTDILPKLIYYMDEPVAGPGLFPQFMVSQMASKNVKVILGGQGGDEICGGYARYVVAYLEQALKGAIFENNEEGEHIVSLSSILPNLPYIKQYVPMIKDFWKKDAFEPMDKRYFSLIDRNGGAFNYYTDDFSNRYSKELIFSRFQKLFNHPETLSYFNKMTHFDMFASLPALLQVEDRMSMAVSIESRVPLLDYRIVELMASMPPAMKFKGAEMKYVLKKSVRDLVPSKILERKDKMGFPVPLHIWAKGKAKNFVKDVLLSDASKNRGIFNPDKVEKLIQSERPFGRQLWGMLCLELWFQQFIDNDTKLFNEEKHELFAVQR